MYVFFNNLFVFCCNVGGDGDCDGEAFVLSEGGGVNYWKFLLNILLN